MPTPPTDTDNDDPRAGWHHQWELEQQERIHAMYAENKNDFELAPEGTHIARCYQIIDLGTQWSDFYKKASHKIRVYWELPTEAMKDGRPFAISKRYTLSWSEKSILRKDIQAWRGKEFVGDEAMRFDITRIVGQCCMVNVVHNDQGGSTYANVAAIVALPKGATCPPAVNTPMIFDLNKFDRAMFDSLPENLRKTISESHEYKSMTGQPATRPATAAAPDFDDDIPF